MDGHQVRIVGDYVITSLESFMKQLPLGSGDKHRSDLEDGISALGTCI